MYLMIFSRRASSGGEFRARHPAWHERTDDGFKGSHRGQEHHGGGAVPGPAEEVLALGPILNARVLTIHNKTTCNCNVLLTRKPVALPDYI